MRVKEIFKLIISKLSHFLFAAKNLEQLAAFRIILCGTLFYTACFRQLNMDQLGPLSLIPRSSALTIFPDFYRPHLQWFFWPDSYVSFVHLGLIALLFFAMIGLSNRALLVLTWIIHQGILNRNYSILFGADVIGGLFLFYLCFTECSDVFSVKNILFRKTNAVRDVAQNNNKNVSLSSVFFRLMQIQICVIYMYTGFEKLKGKTWWDGTALWTVLANPQFSQYDFKFLSHIPLFFAFSTFVTLIFEIYFPAMMINKTYRKYWLIAGVGFHLTIGLLLGLMTFSLIMVATYVLFLQKETLEKVFLKLTPLKFRLS
jgi:hypothetical protein